ncbi:MAG: hypothetical protein H6999_10895 [Hahellaceae bacterium]|nr:hypothetical protein [Hahellaceae bacterium]
MRFILILVALLIVGLLVNKQLNPPPAPELQNAGRELMPPRVPDRPEEVPAFETDLNSYLDDVNEAQRRKIDEQTR